MNAPTHINISDTFTRHVGEVKAMRDALDAYIALAEKDPRRDNYWTQRAWIEVCKAGVSVADDGDFLTDLEVSEETIAADFPYHNSDDGADLSLVHPDNPTQRVAV